MTMCDHYLLHREGNCSARWGDMITEKRCHANSCLFHLVAVALESLLTHRGGIVCLCDEAIVYEETIRFGGRYIASNRGWVSRIDIGIRALRVDMLIVRA